MSKVSVFDQDGNEHIKEPVDARECCNVLGYTMSNPTEVEAKPVVKQKTKPLAKRVTQPASEV
jgi:hypothetical protein